MKSGGRSPLCRGRRSGRVTGEVVAIDKGTHPKRQVMSLGSMLCITFYFTFNSYYENNGNNNTSLSLQNGLKVFILSF